MPKATPKPRSTASSRASKPDSRAKNPKDSHLYTDDNPATTIHGTGFSDKSAARRTLDLIKNRSLTYQFQTVNTMYHRAKHHPSMKKNIEGSAATQGMREAMAVFRHWLDVTYPAERAGQRESGFKPLLSRACVERYLSNIAESRDVGEHAKTFARFYVDLPKGKRLGNVLVDNSKPKEADWERLRYDCLNKLVSHAEATSSAAASEGFWSDEGGVSDHHLHLIAWAWSPVRESKLP